ncbi:uncharacterized protein LOC141649615 [Silene latifolia]|uniref:uncharacterized protein LOC141649615 n=1 Tax=Silene latifolia TaxID=37657 RepID=UPI003D77A8E0
MFLNSWSSGHKFSVKAAYVFFRGADDAGPWTKALVHARIVPSHKFICSLAARQQLTIVDNLQKRGFWFINRCALCEGALETHIHIFFQCPFSYEVWTKIQQWMGIYCIGGSLQQILEIVVTGRQHRQWEQVWFQTSLAATVHQLWAERNVKIFQGRKNVGANIVRRIQFLVSVRMLMWKNHNQYSFIVARLCS